MSLDITENNIGELPPAPISELECRVIKRLDRGRGATESADLLNRHPSSIHRHTSGQCRHPNDLAPLERVLIRTSPGGSAATLHVPNGNGEPVCNIAYRKEKPWIEKSVGVFPPSWRNWCERCFYQLRFVSDE